MARRSGNQEGEVNKIAVSVNAKPVFDWEGGEDERDKILQGFPDAARHVGLTPPVFSDKCLAYLVEQEALLPVDDAGQLQMIGVIWRILITASNDAEHPGRLGDYVGNTDFSVDVWRDASGAFKLHADAFSAFSS
jgi:hypothetical protein